MEFRKAGGGARTRQTPLMPADGLRIINIYPETVSDGFGIRFGIYFAGCSHRCAGCHNPQSWNPHSGRLVDELFFSEIVAAINSNPLLDGVTLSGGDPFFNPSEILKFLKALKSATNLNIWCYSGYTYEQLAADPARSPALEFIDILVDGPFVMGLSNPRLYFRGSANQRILRLKSGKIDGVMEPEIKL
jgi:anaerobic ribonucleoside-triphosphate reductase activating protein